MAGQESVSNVQMARKELAKAVATNESRESQCIFLQQVVCKVDEICQLEHLKYKNLQRIRTLFFA
jgi:hypothetical protein